MRSANYNLHFSFRNSYFFGIIVSQLLAESYD
jgi:hypothetical protein